MTQLDRATGDILLQITGSKPVLLPAASAARLREQLAAAIEARSDE